MLNHLHEVMVAKICHDFASSISAVSNATELLQDGQLGKQALPLLKQASKQLINTIRCYRYAYGPASTITNNSCLALVSMFSDYMQDKKIALHVVNGCGCDHLPHHQARLLAHLILLMASVMPGGTTLNVELISNENNWVLQANSCGMYSIPEGLAALIAGDNIEPTPQNVQTVLFYGIVSSHGGKLMLHHSPKEWTIVASLPQL